VLINWSNVIFASFVFVVLCVSYVFWVLILDNITCLFYQYEVFRLVLPFLLALHQSCMHACDFFHVPAASPPIFPERYSWALLRLSSYINLRVFLPSLVPFQAISLSFPSTFLQEFHVASSKFSWHCHSFSMRFTTSRVSCYISFSLAMRFPILFLLW